MREEYLGHVNSLDQSEMCRSVLPGGHPQPHHHQLGDGARVVCPRPRALCHPVVTQHVWLLGEVVTHEPGNMGSILRHRTLLDVFILECEVWDAVKLQVAVVPDPCEPECDWALLEVSPPRLPSLLPALVLTSHSKHADCVVTDQWETSIRISDQSEPSIQGT